MNASRADVPQWTPPDWMNLAMSWALKTPGLQRLVGRGTALITFTGRKSGKAITTPVSYVRFGDRIVVTTHRQRQWWQNLVANPELSLRLRGRQVKGVASVMDDPDNAFSDFIDLLEAQPVVAKFNDIPMHDGEPDHRAARRALAHTVVVSIKLEREE